VGNGNSDVSDLIKETPFSILNQDFQIQAGSGAWPTAQRGLRRTEILLKVGSEDAYLHSPRCISPLWYKSRQRIKNHRSETARRRSRDLGAITIYAAFYVSGFSVCFLAGQQAFGQTTTPDIVGTVSDAAGAVVMNAKIAVAITATGDTRKQFSGSDGAFVCSPLLPGPYTVAVEAPSFSRMLSSVTVVAMRHLL
jgi:hypothetical protein